jgi:sRNA-binding protein
MTSKASGRAALLLATGIWMGLGAASQAATATDGTTAAATTSRHSSHHSRKYAHRKAAKVADQSAADKKAVEASADNSENTAPAQSSQMPAAVANANAQLASPDAQPTGNIQALTDRANNIVQGTPANTAATGTGAPVLAADQLNDVDRALQEATPATRPVALASAEDPAAAAPPPVVTASPHSDSSTWDQTSLIGKIFIGFGALLTMASAARMFMA